MAIFLRDCPHCGAAHATFDSVYVHSVGYMSDTVMEVDVFSTCPACKRGVIFQVTCSRKLDVRAFGSNIDHANPPPYRCVTVPAARTSDHPEEISARVADLYQQGFDALQRQHWDAAGMAFRKALDIAVKELNPEANPRLPLIQRIDALPAQGGITDALRSWAHIIRQLGNDAAHEDEPFSEQSARGIHNFTRLFLLYTVTMPKEVERLMPRAAGA